MLTPKFKILKRFALLLSFIIVALLLFLPFSHVFEFDLKLDTPNGMLTEYTPEGNIVWFNNDFALPVCFNKDTEGNYFVVDRYTPAYYALDKDNKLIFIYSLLAISISDIKKTTDNNYLLSNNGCLPSLFVVNNLGQIIFSSNVLELVTESVEINNNEYLALSPVLNTIKIVDTNDNIIKESPKDFCEQPSSIQLLENNNYLITCLNIVKEVDHDFNLIKEYTDFLSPAYARKSTNGYFAVANTSTNELFFYNNELTIIKKIDNANVSSINVSPDGNFLVTSIDKEKH